MLEARNFKLAHSDFLEHQGEYDRIIQNPPFGNGADMAHVQHAYDLLKPGGRLVSVVGEGAFFRGDKQATQFRDWLAQTGAHVEKLPENSFMDRTQLATTGANARLVVIDKPADGGVAFHVGPRGVETVSAEDFDATVARLSAGLHPGTVDRIVPVGDYSEIPGRVRAYAESLNYPLEQIKGFVHDNHAYLVRPNLANKAEVEETFVHEVLGHLGTRAIVGDQFTPILNDFWLRMGGTRGVLRVARAFGIERAVSGEVDAMLGAKGATQIAKQAHVVDELIAHASTTGQLNQAMLRFLNNIKEAAYRFAVKHDLPWLAKKLEGWDATDLARFVQQARDAAITGKTPEGDDVALMVGQRANRTPMTDAQGHPTPDFVSKATAAASDLLRSSKTFGKLSDIMTQYHKATRDADFARGFRAVQAFLLDSSRFALGAADKAPGVLPQIGRVRDLPGQMNALLHPPQYRADIDAAGKALFRGTLTDKKVYSDDELRAAVRASANPSPSSDALLLTHQQTQFSQQRASLLLHFQKLTTVQAMLERVLVALGGAAARCPPVHAATPFPSHGGRLARRPAPRLDPAAGRGEQLRGVVLRIRHISPLRRVYPRCSLRGR